MQVEFFFVCVCAQVFPGAQTKGARDFSVRIANNSHSYKNGTFRREQHGESINLSLCVHTRMCVCV